MVAVASAQPGPSSECWQNAANTPRMSEISESDGSATLLVCIFICAKENRSAGPSCGNGMRLLADQNCRQILTADVRNSHCQRQNSQQTYHHTTHTHGALWLMICGPIEKHLLTYTQPTVSTEAMCTGLHHQLMTEEFVSAKFHCSHAPADGNYNRFRTALVITRMMQR